MTQEINDDVHITGKVGIGIENPDEKLEVNGTIIADKFVGDGSGLSKAGQWTDVGGGISYNAGKVGIGTTIPSAKLEVNGDIKANANLVINGNVGIGMPDPKEKLNVFGTIRLHGKNAFQGHDSFLRINQDNEFPSGTHFAHRANFHGGITTGTWWNVDPGAGNLRVQGNVGIGTETPRERLDVIGDVIITGNLGTKGQSSLSGRPGWAGGIHTWDIEAEGTIFSEHGIVGGKAATTTGWALGGGAWGPDHWLRLTTKHGGGTYHDLAVNQFWAAGTTRFDLAEVTPVKVEDQLEQGEVVVIDEEDGLRVKRSTKSYDTSVHGIVSSYESAAMIIGGTGPESVVHESGKLPIALIGRVKAKVSAEAGAIQVGDLLTTSSTPGHLMKCNDISKSTGAVVGKALEPFKSDKGTITILVTL